MPRPPQSRQVARRAQIGNEKSPIDSESSVNARLGGPNECDVKRRHITGWEDGRRRLKWGPASPDPASVSIFLIDATRPWPSLRRAPAPASPCPPPFGRLAFSPWPRTPA